MHVLISTTVLAGILVFACMVWRFASLPCPWWLGPLLENRYVEAIAGASLLLDRAGVREGMWILDAGCGPGRLTLPAAQRIGKSGRVVALDLQPQMIARLQSRTHAAGFQRLFAGPLSYTVHFVKDARLQSASPSFENAGRLPV